MVAQHANRIGTMRERPPGSGARASASSGPNTGKQDRLNLADSVLANDL